jgi:3-hydroxyisobutyrate dehydrogenase-like beta-hydroxyacid dehydrogenase
MQLRVGFIGLGQMGEGMAINVAKAGFDLTVYDLGKDQMNKLVSYGASTTVSPKELAKKCDWILLSLPGTKEVKSVIFENDGIVGGLHEGLVIIDCGTTHPLATREIASSLKEKKVSFLDAPVSGMHSRAMEGTLTIMVGGEENVFRRVKKVLASFSDKIIYMGESGNGQLTKLINQLLFNIGAAAIAEILPMAVKMGLNPEKVVDVVKTGTGRSFALEFFGPLILADDFKPGYQLAKAYKDMASAAEISSHNKIPLPVTAAATFTYQLALTNGLGDENKGAMIKVWEKILGVKVRKKRL